MKLTIYYSKKEIESIIPVTRNIGMDDREVMNMINDFEIGGKNLSIKHSCHNKSLELEIHENIVVRFFRRFNPIIDVIKSLVKLLIGFCEDMAEDFDDVEVKNCYSRNYNDIIKKNRTAKMANNNPENGNSDDVYKSIESKIIENSTVLNNILKDDPHKETAKEIAERIEREDARFEAEIDEMEKHYKETRDEEAMEELQAENKEFYRSLEGE